ncbi:hypothetical protein [Quadrisphaera sp. KR29]|uniref:hypothetical protein n=1 Tax=Quadrisphaera sp. KR29 TaxID=3461391 RepID=UPI0040440F69
MAQDALPDAVLQQLHERSDLLGSWWPAAALAGLALALVALGVLRRRGGGRGRRPRRRPQRLDRVPALGAGGADLRQRPGA